MKQLLRCSRTESLIVFYIHSFNHSGYLYSASSCPLLLSYAPDTVSHLINDELTVRKRNNYKENDKINNNELDTTIEDFHLIGSKLA